MGIRLRGRSCLWLAVGLATPVYLLVLALILLGCWLLWPGSNWVLKILGILCLLTAWTLRPRPVRSGGDPVAETYVEGALGILRRCEELIAPYRPDFKMSPEHQVLLAASGGRDIISQHARSGLLADVVSVLLWPLLMITRLYRGLMERTLRRGGQPPAG